MAKSDKVRFRDTLEQVSRIEKDVAKGEFAPLYLLMGPEGYFIDRVADLLNASILPEEQKAFNQTVVYGKDSDAGAIVNLCRQMPMMGGRQAVFIREAQSLGKAIEKLALYTANPSPHTILVICHKEKNLDKRTQLYKQIASQGVVMESVAPYDNEMEGWLQEYFKGRSLGIEPKALRMLTDNLGTDIAKTVGEVQKLLTGLDEGIKSITAQHIEERIGISKDFNTFELTKALSERNAAKALLIADHFARNPKENPLVVTLSTLYSHFQRIFTLNYLVWQSKRPGGSMPSEFDLSRTLKLPHPMFLNEYRQAAGLYPNKKVFGILGMIRECDMKSKGMNDGGMDDGELLRGLLLQILNA